MGCDNAVRPSRQGPTTITAIYPDETQFLACTGEPLEELFGAIVPKSQHKDIMI